MTDTISTTSFARTEVKRHNGVPTIFVDGEPMHGMTATSCAFNDPQVVQDFVAAGTEIMMIWIEAGIKCWNGPGQYDWTYAEEKLRHFEANSGDSKWIIRVRLGLLNHWFKHAYPDEVHKPAKGPDDHDLSVCNLTSSIWLEHVNELIHAFVSWLKTTKWADRIIGFMLNAGSSEEWLIFDTGETYNGHYQSAYTREFRGWLQRKYETVEALRASWKKDDVTFETATCPVWWTRQGSHIWGPFSLRNPQTDRPAIDYYYFLNETLANAYIAICKSAKQAAGSPIIVGGFHSYLWWESGVYSYIQEYGHTLIQRLKASPWVDFISDITSYDDRYPGGPSGYLGLPHSINIDNKLHYTEVDLQTIANLDPKYIDAWAKADISDIPVRTALPVIPDQIWKWEVGYCGRSMDEQVALLQREHMHNIITGTPFWWFDIRSHNYQAPAMVKAMKHLSDIGKQSVNWDRGSVSEVAFVLSEDTPMYQAAMNGSLLRFELEANHTLLIDLANRNWGLAGVPFDVYEINDLGNPNFPGDQYKLIVFVNCAFIPDSAVEGIRKWQRDGRVMVWTHAAGVLNEEQLDPSIGSDVIGMKLGWRNERQHVHVEVEDAGHPLTKGGKALSFWTEGSIGPIFFADDPQATVLGHLLYGEEAAFAVREHDGWRSIYLSMLNFGPQLLRNLAEFAGAHVWCTNNDVIYANNSIVCLHTPSNGERTINLPAPAYVTDLWTGERTAEPVTTITVDVLAYRTRAWRTEYVAE